jgi:hypothetical protein
MTAWSDYLRQQAIVADRVAGSMRSPESQEEFADFAASYRRDADIEDGMTSAVDPSGRLPRRRH